MGERYEIRTLDDLVTLWAALTPEKRETFTTDLVTWMNISTALIGSLGERRQQVRMAFTWVDDGKNDFLGLMIRPEPATPPDLE